VAIIALRVSLDSMADVRLTMLQFQATVGGGRGEGGGLAPAPALLLFSLGYGDLQRTHVARSILDVIFNNLK